MILRTMLSLLILFQTWLPVVAMAATEFTTTVKSSGGDATTFSAAEAITDEDLTVADIKVFSISAASTPTLVDGEIVAGVTSLATGVCVHVNAARTQVLIKTIVGTFSAGEVVKKSTDAAVTVTLSNPSNVDSPIVAMALYASASPDTTAVAILGATTNSTNYVRAYTPAGEGNAGKYDATKYLLNVTNGLPLQINDNYVRIEGLQIENNSLTADNYVIYITQQTASNEIRITGNIIKSANSSTYRDSGIYFNDADIVAKVWNNVIYNIGSLYDGESSIIRGLSLSTLYLYNNTLSTSQPVGISFATGTIIAKNNLVVGTNDIYTYYGTFASGTDYNSTNRSDSIGVGSNNRISQTFSFVDSANGDFHIKSTDTGALNFGTDLSADANIAFTNDIDSIITRYGTWDIGADELGFITNGGATGGTGLLHGTVVH